MQAITLVTFTYTCAEDELGTLATAFVDQVRPRVPGLLWKIFLHRPEARRAGGVYLFDDAGSARRYAEGEYVAGLRQADILRDVSVEVFEILGELSIRTGAPL